MKLYFTVGKKGVVTEKMQKQEGFCPDEFGFFIKNPLFSNNFIPFTLRFALYMLKIY